MAGQVVRAGAVLLSGAFVVLTVFRPAADLSRALLATAIATVALAGWAGVLGVSWVAVSHGFERDLWASNRTFIEQLAASGTPSDRVGPLMDQLSSAASASATLLPALLVLAAIAGLRLAWSWHHRIAAQPIGEPPPRFETFAFSDQLVWLLVAGLGLALLPRDEGWHLAAMNLLALGGALYAVRGLAVFSAGSGRVPRAGFALLTVVAMFLLPFVVGGLTLLGLADTWLDFRRRRATPAT